MPVAYLSLGSNLGDRKAQLDQAVDALGKSEGVRVLAVSPYHETPPVGGPAGQGPFLNGAVVVETSREPIDLLHQLQSIERDAGRVRTVRWGERTLDLDLLLYDDRMIWSDELTVPHTRMALRRFVLGPLAEVAPEAVDPITGRTVASLLANLDRRPSYVALHRCPRPTLTLLGEGQAPWSTQLDHAVRVNASAAPDPDHPDRLFEFQDVAASRLADQLCATLPGRRLRYLFSVERPRSQPEYQAAVVDFANLLLDDWTRVDLLSQLSPKAIASVADSGTWIVSGFSFDAIADHWSTRWRSGGPGGLLNCDHEYRSFVEARSQTYPPTFVVVSRDDWSSLARWRPWDTESQLASVFPGRDTPILLVDEYGSEQALRDAVAACAATRAG